MLFSTQHIQNIISLVSCGCYNKLPQTGCLKTIEIYPHTVLETRCSKSRCRQGHNLGALRENSFFVSSSFSWLLVFLDQWPHHYNLCFLTHMAPSSVCQTSLGLPLKRAPVTGGPQDNPGEVPPLEILFFFISRFLITFVLPIRKYSRMLGMRTRAYLLGDLCPAHYNDHAHL